MNGFINLLKPPGVTSHDMVNLIRKELNIKKVGHGGTLDPGAAGVLVIGIGKATRLLEYAIGLKKKYRTEITFGITTTSADSFGEVIEEKNNFKVDEENLQRILKDFKGEIIQIPPMTSAIKNKGKKLYELARKGIEIQREPRKIFIYSLKLVSFIPGEKPKAFLDIECSKGTYIRTLCHDIGLRLGCGAYMSFLVRTGVGEFCIVDSLTPQEISEYINDKDLTFIKPMNSVLEHLPKVIVSNSKINAVLNGVFYHYENTQKLTNNQEVQLLTENKKLLAIGRVLSVEKKIIKPEKVFKN